MKSWSEQATQVAPPTATPIVAATGDDLGSGEQTLERARAFAQPLLVGRALDTGEEVWAHAQGVVQVLDQLGAAPSLKAAAYLLYCGDVLQRPEEVLTTAFGESYAGLVTLARKLVQVQRATRDATLAREDRQAQTERVRKMLLAFSRDLRVVLLRLASRLQTLRWFAASKQPCPAVLAQESQQVFAPLANRLGLWQIKWELEDLAFRFLQPDEYKRIAKLLDETRRARELGMVFIRHQLDGVLRQAGVQGDVQGRPKHLYSIYKKMSGKSLPFERVLDLRAMRVIVADVPACYAALSAVHSRYRQIPEEFDDYIARPKPNGYQSIHTVILDDEGRAVEVQIRTREMHDHAESGTAAHWAYKEAGAKGYAGVSASAESAQRMAEARQAVMRQLLAWERDFVSPSQEGASPGDDAIFVLTPQFTVVELPSGATPIDFAYSLHTDLGHRCRGAKVDGQLVPLNTALRNGQTVEVTAAKEGGPSLDWLNAELGFLRSHRARSKVRAWFNAQALAQTIAKGREAVERLLQREGKTAIKFDELADRLGFKGAEALFEVVGKDEFSLHQIEVLLRPPPVAAPVEDRVALSRSRAGGGGGVLVVGLDSLMTSLSRCCRPVPPDAIQGFVTRGKGVSIHRSDCSNLLHMAAQAPGRVIDVAWGDDVLAGTLGAAASGRPSRSASAGGLFPIDLQVTANDRQGLLRDISDVLARHRVNVTGVNTRSLNDAMGASAHMTFTVEVPHLAQVQTVLREMAQVSGVRSAKRR